MSIKPSEWQNQSSSSQYSTLESVFNRCFEETDNITLKAAELKYIEDERRRTEDFNTRRDEILGLIKEAKSASEFKEYDEAFLKMKSAVDLLELDVEIKKAMTNYYMASVHNSVAWYALLNNDLESCNTYLKNGMKYDFNNMLICGNKGLYHLLNNQYDDALNAFTKFKRRDKLTNTDRKWIDVIAEDLAILESLGFTNSDFDKIRKELNIDQSIIDQFKNKFSKDK